MKTRTNMRQGNDHAFEGGSADQYVIESWIGALSLSVPETEEWTFARSVRDFSTRFLKREACRLNRVIMFPAQTKGFAT